MNQSDPAQEPSLYSSCAKLINGVYETYFQPSKTSLNWGWRFLCAWLGAATLFVSALGLFGIGPGKWITDSKTAYLVGIIGPILYGCLIASAKTPHGPVRLYLSGLLLSVFVVGLLLGTLSPGAGTNPEKPASILIPIPD